MTERATVLKDVIEEGVVPFWYEHSQRQFTVGSNQVPLWRATGYDIARQATKDDRIKDAADLDQFPVTHGLFSEPIAMSALSKMLASCRNVQGLQQEIAQVISEVHEELAFPIDPILINAPIINFCDYWYMDFTIMTHDSLHVTQYSLIPRDSQLYGIFEYGFNNANDHPATRPALLSGLGHLAFITME